MRAISYVRYGPPEVLHLADLSTPVPKDDEVLIRVRAAEATKADCEMRSFRFSVRWFWLPLRLALGVRRPRRYDNLGGATFADSPLVRQQDYVAAGVAVAWVLGESSTRVRVDD